jgi:transcriptional regulator with XRE-family HTH domain
LASGYVEWEPTQRQTIAARLGVSPRTLRRWLNQGTTPSNANIQRIQQAGSRQRSRLKRAGYPDMARIPYGHRRMLKEWDFTGRKPVFTGRYYVSTWINYHVEGWSPSEMLGLIERAYGFGNRLQFIFKINRGEDAGLGIHGASRMYDVDGHEIEDFANIIDEIMYRYTDDDEAEPNEIIWIGLLDPKSRFK